MASLFKLVGEVFVDTTQANENLQKTGDKAEKTGNKFKEGLGKATKVMAGITAGAIAVGTSVVAMANKTAQQMDVIDKASQRMKISAESYQELAYASERCGVEMSVLEKASKKLEGTDLNLDDALNQIMALGSEAERSAKASELFGDAVAYQMTPLLNVGAEGFDELKQKANDLGLVFSQESVSAGATLGDTMADVKESLGAVATEIGIELLPIVQKVLDWVVEHMPEIKAIIKGAIDFIVQAVKTITPIVIPIIQTIGKALEWIIDLIKRIVDGFKNFKMPQIKLPHFAINPKGWKIGDLLKGSIPKLGVEWYAKAMDNPIMMTQPTIFGASGGKLLGGGEAGNEIVIGQNKMLEMMQSATQNQFNALSDRVDALIGLLQAYLPDMANKKLVLDTGALVGELAEPINIELGRMLVLNGRGG